MKWHKIKSILLGMLIAMNLFLVGELLYKRVSNENIPAIVYEAAGLALENNGIACDAGLIPKKYVSSPKLSVNFPSPMELSKMFFGSQQAFQTDGDILTAHKDGAVLRVEGESFCYYTSAEPKADPSEKELKKALKTAGIDMSRGAYSDKYGIFVFYYNDRPLFGMYLRAELDEYGRICRAEGRWPEITSVSSAETGLSIISRLPALCDKFKNGGEIESIRFGYALAEESAAEGKVFVPAWQVRMKDNRTEIFT